MNLRVPEVMASSLKDLWTTGRKGNLCPQEQSRAWALREVYREMGVPEKKLCTKVAQKLVKVGGGKKGKKGSDRPTPRAVLKLFSKMDNDDDWFPGKVEEGGGRKQALSPLAKSVIARSAMTIKRKGGEPTYKRMVGTCPDAVKNPSTNRPVDKKRVYNVFETQCYDDGADKPWKHRKKLTKTALPDPVIKKRLKWHDFMVGLGHTGDWYYKNMIWIDLCNDIIPTSEKKATEMALARKGGKGWISPGTQEFSRNLQGKKESLKQKSWNTYKIWWMPVLCRGKLHIEVFNEEFPGECAPGAQQAVEKLASILNLRFPNQSKPKIVMTDRGRGFYHPPTGKITKEYKAGLQHVGLKAFMGDDASAQPGTMGDLMLHETSVAWIRKLMGERTPARAWQETREEFKSRIQAVARHINAKFDVENLCWEVPDRLKELKDRKGDKLKK